MQNHPLPSPPSLSPISRIRSQPIIHSRRRTVRALPQRPRQNSNLPRPTNPWNDGTSFSPTPTIFQPSLTALKSQFQANADSTPFDLVKQFFGEPLVNGICTETNRFADEIRLKFPSRLKKWKTVRSEELWRFMALNTLMGLIRKNDIKDYWSLNELLSTPIFGRTMSPSFCRQRHNQLLQ